MSDYPNDQATSTPGASAYEPVAGAPGTPYPGSGGVPPIYPGVPYAPGTVPVPGAPNPALAAVLGFIPGVGAMYNGQFAKGIAHIAIFAVFSTLSEHGNSIFGLLVAGWVFYMVFEAYQTARARRNGWPLPDPFGLNNVGERFGFKGDIDFSSFRAGPPMGNPPPFTDTPHVDPVTGAVHYARTDTTGTQTAYHVDPAGQVYAATSASSSAAGYAPPPPPPEYASPATPPPPGYPPYPGPYAAPAQPFGTGPYAGTVYNNASPAPVSMPPAGPGGRGGLPVGALWLIGFGLLALLGSLRPFRFLEGEATGGLFLIGISVLIFLRSGFRSGFYAPGTPAARWNIVRSARGAGIVFIVGLLTLLQGLHVMYWSSSWPFLLIFLGAILVVERLAANSLSAAAYTAAPYAGQAAAPPAAEPPVAETASPTSITPRGTSRPIADSTNDEGGR